MLFARNPGEWQKVLADPGKIPNAVEETLRYTSPSQYQGRTVTRDVVHGRRAGESAPDLLVCVTDATNLRQNLRLVLSPLHSGFGA